VGDRLGEDGVGAYEVPLADEIRQCFRAHPLGEGLRGALGGVVSGGGREERIAGDGWGLRAGHDGAQGSAKPFLDYRSRVAKWVKGGVVCAVVASAIACSARPPETAIDDSKSKVTAVDVAEFEITESGIDRFTSCPPAGELGQQWLPPIPAWTPVAAPVDPSDEVDAGAQATATEADAESPSADETHGTAERLERFYADTRMEFRHCYHRGLLYDPTQDGHAAIVLRVGGDGRVQKVEVWGACDLSHDALACMMDVASKERFPTSPTGSHSFAVPVVMSPSGGSSATPQKNDGYTASAYIAVERARPSLHACVEQTRKDGKAGVATATFDLDLDATGHIAHANIDPWTGDQDLLACAAKAMDEVAFPPPPAGRGRAMVRLSFNPRPGTK
jgi:hypothetical protein